MKKLLLIALLSLVLLTFGCPEDPQEAKTGKLSLSITDKQVEGIEELHVTITAVEIHKAGATGDENSNGNSNRGDNSSWILFSEEEKTFDLMQLKSSEGLKEVLGEKELEVGKYTQIRLTVKEVKAKINGEEFDVEVPSDKLKIVHGFEIKEGEETELIIDFSPESVISANGGYKLKPVIKILTPKQFQERKQSKEQKMTLERAREIAENSECINEGVLKENAQYNENSKTWWIDFEPTEPKEGCNPVCVVNKNENAEINWRCTGLQEFCEIGKKYRNNAVDPVECECPKGYEFETVSTGPGPCPEPGMTDCPETELRCVESQELQGKGIFTLLLSDAEADITDFESVNVSFDHARIFQVDSNTGFTEIDLNGASVDLTTVVGELAVPLVQMELDAGTYSKIELYVLDVEAILLDGNTAEVTVPSGKLRIIKPFTIDANTETKFVFDIQIVKKGQTNEYNLFPVVAKSGVVGKDLDEDEVEEIEPEEEIEVDDSEFLEDVCDGNTSCPTGYECADFPAEVGLKCYPITGTESVCDFVTCPAGYECVIEQSYPVQISCAEITE